MYILPVLTGEPPVRGKTLGHLLFYLILPHPSFGLFKRTSGVYQKEGVMAYRLPSQPNLKHLKNQAKALVRDHRNGNLAAAHRIKKHLPRLAQAPVQSISSAEFSLQEAQHILAREYGFASWKQLLAFIEAKAKPRANPLTQEEIDALLDTTRHAEEEVATALPQEKFDGEAAFNEMRSAVVEKNGEKTVWDWADGQLLRSLSDLHYYTNLDQKLFTKTLTEQLGHQVIINGGTINHEHSFHFMDEYLMPPPQYFFSFTVSPMGKPAYIHISKSILCCYLGIPYKSEKEPIPPRYFARLPPFVEALLGELVQSFSPWLKITCSELTLCLDVNDLRLAEEDEYSVSERFIIKSQQIRASLADRICLLYPRSVLEPILSSAK